MIKPKLRAEIIESLSKYSFDDLKDLSVIVRDLTDRKKTDVLKQKRAQLNVGDHVRVNHPKLSGNKNLYILKVNIKKCIVQDRDNVWNAGWNIPITLIEKI